MTSPDALSRNLTGWRRVRTVFPGPPSPGRPLTLGHARRAYLGEVADDWDSCGDAAQRLADQLALNVTEATKA